ncbi:circadian clock-controlled protein daywake-like [Leguminivora glycinivorella]|uniref:circadian clock-controlled protein daywake-like n=1 Tax=Leguminivora glycinivorella TaxID=1035111 RepID=UPI00200DA4DB|nr:circadian clock-controlled protein daywake-like [Leguminivora glycinivorella]
MGVIFKFVVALVAVNFVNCAVIPGVDKCNLEDSSCMTPAFQKAFPLFMAGLPEQGVEVLDVMNMDDVAFDLSGLQFSLKEGKLKGLKTGVVDHVKWNLQKKTLAVSFHLDSTIKGHYVASGRILILPITGDGQMKLKMKNILIKLLMHYEVEKDAQGKEHMVPTKYSFDFDVRDNAHFSLTNLFNGNKELSDAMLKFLNENWKQISIEFGRPLVDSASKKIFKNVKAFLQSVPIHDIAQL